MPRPRYRSFHGDRLRELRREHGWTQEQIAVRLGIYPTMIGKWESGRISPAAASVARLAEVLGVPPQTFCSEDYRQLSLVDLRVRSGLSRPQAADRTGMSQRRLAQYEHAASRPTPTDAYRLAETYGVPTRTVFDAYERQRAETYPELADDGAAPELSAAERAVVERFEAAPVLPEAWHPASA